MSTGAGTGAASTGYGPGNPPAALKRSGSGILRRRGSSTPKSPLLGDSIPKEIIEKREKLWKRIYEYQGIDKESLLSSIANHMEFTLFSNRNTAVDSDVFSAVSLAVRDRLIEVANDTEDIMIASKCKKIYYLSLEYLMGRSLTNNLASLGLQDTVKEALEDIGYDLSEILELERDPGLGNGGLGSKSHDSLTQPLFLLDPPILFFFPLCRARRLLSGLHCHLQPPRNGLRNPLRLWNLFPED